MNFEEFIDMLAHKFNPKLLALKEEIERTRGKAALHLEMTEEMEMQAIDILDSEDELETEMKSLLYAASNDNHISKN